MRDRTIGISEAMILAGYYGEEAKKEMKEGADKDWIYNTVVMAAHYAIIAIEIIEEIEKQDCTVCGLTRNQCEMGI